MTGRVYLITNIVTGKKYVGQTVQTGKRRFLSHKRAALKYRSPLPIHRAIRKYGIENFRYEVIEECDSIESLNIAESKWISKLDTFGSNGYNCTTGGEGFAVSDETKQKMSQSKTGIKLSKEHCGAISAGITGENNPFYGKTHSEETIRKIKETLAGQMDGENNPFYGKQHSEDSLKKMSESHKGKNIGVKAGVKHHNIKLTDVIVLRIRQLALEGATHLQLSKMFGVTRQTITKIVNRQKWRHI